MDWMDHVMSGLTGLPWAEGRAALLLAGGAFFLLLGLRTAWSLREFEGTARNIRRLQRLGEGFRFVVVGVCLFGVGLSFSLDVGWLYAFALVFGLEELWEATVLSSLLADARRAEERAEARRLPEAERAAACAEWDRRAGRLLPGS